MYNVPAAFDIETSNFYDKDENKVALMYVWQFGIDGKVIVGRTWAEFTNLLRMLQFKLGLGQYTKLFVGVHNLSFEFQFIKKLMKWERVFALKAYDVLEAETESGFVFRCTLKLSGMSLEKVGENLIAHEVKKLSGDLDYDLIRTPETPLTEKEYGYAVNDVKVVMAFLEEERDRNNGRMCDIPLTKTGYARLYTRQQCFGERDSKQDYVYHDFMKHLTLTLDEYNTLRRAFAGGFTHGSFDYVGKVVENVDSLDLCSDYPYQICANKFPMSKGQKIDKLTYKQFYKHLNEDCCVFDVEFTNIVSTLHYDYYISRSHCWAGEGFVTYNGRVTEAKRLCMTLTDVDFKIIQRFYKWDGRPKIKNFWVYKKDYLPKSIIEAVLQLYADKTTLKNVDGKEVEYMVAKALLNSIYGMFVSRILRDNWSLDDDAKWQRQEQGEPELKKENYSRTRFSFYPWGVFVTAEARKAVMQGIEEFKGDYLYSDTDSLKVVNLTKHQKWVDDYNAKVYNRLEKMATARGIDMELFNPADRNGNRHLMGVWEHDAHYTRFKFLGAKRYIFENDGKINITVAGLNKKVAVPWMTKQWSNDECFSNFNDGLKVPKEYTGKLTHTYIDDERTGTVVDYLGNAYDYKSLSGVHLEQTEYNLSAVMEFIRDLKKAFERKEISVEQIEGGYEDA